MASSSNTAHVSLNHQIFVKLARGNYLLWRAQVLPKIMGAQLFGFLDGTVMAPAKIVAAKDAKDNDKIVTNPTYAIWEAQD
jgi:hypothetical protein